MKTFVGAAALLAATVSFADAADLSARPYTKAPIAAPAPIFSWTGFYVGANVGGGWGDRTVDYVPNDVVARISIGNEPAPFAIPGSAFKTSGFLGGVQVGYNYQVGANWLLGIEADFNGADIAGQGESRSTRGGGTVLRATLPVEEQIKWFGTVRGRLGALPTPNLLTYVTGGFAYAQVNHRGSAIYGDTNSIIANSGGGVSVTCGHGGTEPLTCYTGSASNVAFGWTAGGGLEYALGPNWTIKGEYLFISLDGNSIRETAVQTVANGTGPSSFNGNFSRASFHVGRIGVNYRFGGPVVAKY
jgi:outer membrane immunogenic protein